jgi:hypothetical protein
MQPAQRLDPQVAVDQHQRSAAGEAWSCPLNTFTAADLCALFPATR